MNEQEKVRAGLSKENEHDVIIIIKNFKISQRGNHKGKICWYKN